MKKIIKYFSLFEWCLYLTSVLVIILTFILFENKEYFYMIGSLIGVTALIFLSKASPIGQIITVIFAIFYGVVSYSYKYYGEMITYLCMTLPIATISIISWYRNLNSKNKNEVLINEIKYKEYILVLVLAIIVTIVFYFILKALNTNSLIISTLSITTSFVAAYLSLRRSRFYALAYGINDIVLIVLWSIAAYSSLEYMSMVICFMAFLASDVYAFINWGRIQKTQTLQKQ